MKQLILNNEKLLNDLHKQLLHAARNKANNLKTWQEAAQKFQESYDRLAFPGGLNRQLELLKKHDANAIDAALVYLQVNPYYFRSGYIKQQLAHLLKKAPLTKTHKERLLQILLDAVQEKPRREFIEYCRLARVLADAPFIQKLEQLAHTLDNPTIQHQAQKMLAIVTQ
jgi:hypothetical protein